jgi:hypothetical protein
MERAMLIQALTRLGGDAGREQATTSWTWRKLRPSSLQLPGWSVACRFSQPLTTSLQKKHPHLINAPLFLTDHALSLRQQPIAATVPPPNSSKAHGDNRVLHRRRRVSGTSGIAAPLSCSWGDLSHPRTASAQSRHPEHRRLPYERERVEQTKIRNWGIWPR